MNDPQLDGMPFRHDERYLMVLQDIAESLRRLADAATPDPGEQVGTPYVAKRLGITPIYVGQMAREGKIPKSCVVHGTGDGKPWKFLRERIDRWMAAGRPQT